ncbi:MAG: nucleoside-triphosphatase [Pseudomonadota bacterium]
MSSNFFTKRRLLGILALGCIAVQFNGSLALSGLALVIWIIVLALFDRISLRRLWMPKFWLFTIFFALGSGLLLGKRNMHFAGIAISSVGLEAGFLMVLRGAFIFGLASWASRALRDEDLRRFTSKVGLGKLGTSVGVALRILPELKDRMANATQAVPVSANGHMHRLGRIYETAVQMVCQTAILADQMANESDKKRPIVVAVLGQPGEGKTTVLSKVVEDLKERGLKVGGIGQPVIMGDGPVPKGYLLRDYATNETRPFAHKNEPTDRRGSGFSFDQDAWDWARIRIIEARETKDVVVVDEMGNLEAQGNGHLPALLEKLETQEATVWLLAVRADCAGAIQQRLGTFNLLLTADSNSDKVDDFVGRILEQIPKSR